MTTRHHNHDHQHHDHDPHQGDEPGHQHSHHGGVVGAVRHLVAPHSHDHAEVIDSAAATHEGLRTLGVSLGGLGVTAGLQVAVLAISGSVALLADTIHNVSDALTAVPIGLAFWLGRRPPDRRYTYGYGRAEDLAGIFVVAMIALSAVVAGYQAVQRLLDPQVLDHPGWLAVAGIIGFAGNELVAIYRIRTGRRIGSAALVADGLHARTDGLTSLAVVGAAVGTIAGWAYADPIIGLAISAAIVNVGRHAARDIYRRLMDHADPALVDSVEHQLDHIDGIRGVDRVRVRWVGHQVHVDADVVLDAHLDLAGAHDILEDARHRLFHTVPRLADALLHASPTSGTGDPHATTRHHLVTS
jgi:cation diffusion facilitator family transporter